MALIHTVYKQRLYIGIKIDLLIKFFHSSGSKTQQQMTDKNGSPTGTQLTITNADSSDGGTYTCVSANTHGEITRSVQLTVAKSSSKRLILEDIGEKLR